MMTRWTGSSWDHRSINACLRPVLACDGMSITTVEGIGSKRDSFHPVQERMAKCNGSQCGFCTPGHVMSMYSLLRETTEASQPLELKTIENRFDGNICRCTGYRSIMSAMHSFASEGSPDLDVNAIEGADSAPFEPYDPARDANVGTPDELKQYMPSNVTISDRHATWHQCTTIQQAVDLVAANPDTSKIVCANTSTGPWGADSTTQVIVDVSKVAELGGIDVSASGVTFGATTTLTDVMNTFRNNASVSPGSFPKLADHIAMVASWQVSLSSSSSLFLSLSVFALD